MQSSNYSLNQHTIATLLHKIKSEEIAIPEIQRPFVWSANKVRDLIDSLYHGYPVGYLITWPKSGVSLRDGTISNRELILIDGQQRMMALRTALLGEKVFTKKYMEKQIQIAFHPDKEEFAIPTKVIKQDSGWIPDISNVFNSDSNQHRFIREYCENNQGRNEDKMAERIEKLYQIREKPVGIIELDPGLNVQTVAEIFKRINLNGVKLNSSDYIMSKMAASEQYNGHLLRKSIDCFCHLATVPDAYNNLTEDATFADTDYFRAIEWLKDWHDNLYTPKYSDVLQVVFASEFKRGDLSALVDFLSGDSAESAFNQLANGISNYMNETNFKRFIQILSSAGFEDDSMLTAGNAVNSAYILFLTLRARSENSNQIENLVRRWFVMSVLTERYSGEPRSTLSEDVRNINAQEGAEEYLKRLERTELSEAFWKEELPQKLDKSGSKNVYFQIFLASQLKKNDKGFLSRDITVRDLFRGQKDVHHIFPKKYLEEKGIEKKLHNQLANLAVMQKNINITIGNTAPAIYFSELQGGCEVGSPPYGGIDSIDELQTNLDAHCIPHRDNPVIFENYAEFLEKRRILMAKKIRKYYESL